MRLGDKQNMLVLMALVMMAPGAATAQAKPADAPPAAMQKLLQSCDAHKFETVIQTMVDGKPHRSKMKLCGTEGQSDADWVRTLKDALAKVSVNAEMPQPVRDQIATALKGEIGRLTIEAVPSASQTSILPPPRPARPAQNPLSRDYAALPPLTATPTVAPPRLLVPNAPMLPKPRMTLTCFAPADLAGDGPCIAFERDTMVTVRADEDLPAGTSLRFVRNGDNRAEVELAQLKRGRSMRFALPREVCSHAVGGSLELRIVRAGQEVGTDGPYNLRC
jgi:hypothetical protein